MSKTTLTQVDSFTLRAKEAVNNNKKRLDGDGDDTLIFQQSESKAAWEPLNRWTLVSALRKKICAPDLDPTRDTFPPWLSNTTNIPYVAQHLYRHQIITYPTNNIFSRLIFNALSIALGFGRRNWACSDVSAVTTTASFFARNADDYKGLVRRYYGRAFFVGWWKSWQNERLLDPNLAGRMCVLNSYVLTCPMLRVHCKYLYLSSVK